MAALRKTTAVLTWLLAADSANCLPRSAGTTTEKVLEISATQPQTPSFKTQYPPSDQRIIIPTAEPVCHLGYSHLKYHKRPLYTSVGTNATLRTTDLLSTAAAIHRSFLFRQLTLGVCSAASTGCCCLHPPPCPLHIVPPTHQTITPQIQHLLSQVGAVQLPLY